MCMCMCMCMATKTITIMEDAYKILLNRKHKNESFSGVIRRITGEKKDIMRFAGAWKDLSEDEIEKMKNGVAELRKESTEELFKRIKRVRDSDMS